jgi:hypothetical protein
VRKKTDHIRSITGPSGPSDLPVITVPDGIACYITSC